MPKQDQFANLDSVSCNTEVHLQILTPTKPIRLRTRLIGIDPKSSIIIALGNDKHWLSAKDFIREGQGVIVRLFNSDISEANIIAFRSNINSVFTAAGRWLVLRYPLELQQAALRQHSRLPINVNSTIHTTDNEQSLTTGHLSDISVMGGSFIGNTIKAEAVNTEFMILLEGAEKEKISALITIKNEQHIDAANQLSQYGFVLNGSQSEADNFVQKVLQVHLNEQAKIEQPAKPVTQP